MVTHAHQDHILDVEAIAKRTNAVIISNYEIVTYYGNLGFEGHPMNHGGQWEWSLRVWLKTICFGPPNNKSEYMMNEVEITSKEKFAAEIRKLARDNNLNLIEAITSYCEDHDVMMEDIIPLIDKNLKEELRCDAIDNRYVVGIPKPNKLF